MNKQQHDRSWHDNRILLIARKTVIRWHTWYVPNKWFDQYQLDLCTVGLCELRSLYNDCISSNKFDKEYPFIVDLLEPLSNSEEKRLRYGKQVIKRNKYPMLGPRWGVAFTLYFEVLGKYRNSVHRILFNEFDIREIKNSRNLYAFLKEVSTIFKQCNSYLVPFWRYLVNLETFGGYVDGTFTDRDRGDILKWVTEPYPKYIDGIEDNRAFDKLFTQFVPQIRKHIRFRTIDELSPSEFISDITKYCTNGSTDWVNNLKIDGERVRNNKSSSFLSMRPKDLLQSLFAFERPTVKMLAKRETGKLRYVASCDNHLYLQQTYVSTYIEPLLKGCDRSTLFMTNSQIRTFKGLVLENIRDRRNYSVPLDQSEFDHQPSMSMIMSILYFLDSLIPKNYTCHKYVMSLIISEIKSGSIITMPDNSKVIHKKGVLSGWRWTALIDTLINIVLFEMCYHKLLETQCWRNSLVRFNAQGDDDLLIFDNVQSALLIVDIYKRYGLKVNLKKFFISNQYNEYLRIVYDYNSSKGYPARSMISLLMNNPINKEQRKGELRARSQATNWLILQSRGCCVEKQMISDIASGNDLTEEEVVQWMHTPSTFNGLGLRPYCSRWLSLKDGGYRFKGHVTGVKLVDWSDRFVRDTVRPMLDSRSYNEKVLGTKKVVDPIYPLPRLRFTIREKLQPRFTDKNTFRNNILIKRYIDERDIVSLEAMMTPKYRQLSRKIRNYCSRYVHFSWIQGKLPFSMPAIPGWSEADVSPYWLELCECAWANLLSMRHVNKRLLLRGCLTAEVLLPSYLPANITLAR